MKNTEPETQTAQIPVSEPLSEPETVIQTSEPEILPESNTEILESANEEVKPEIPETISDPIQTEIKQAELTIETKTKNNIQTESKSVEQIYETKTETQQIEEVKSEPVETKSVPVIISTRSKARELLIKARNAIQSRKRKKLDKVMTLFLKKQKITNDEVEKFLHVSDATATRYLSQLEKEGKIKQNGKTGKSVFYSKL